MDGSVAVIALAEAQHASWCRKVYGLAALELCRLPVYDINVIGSFQDPEAERIFNGIRSRRYGAIAKMAYRKLAILHSARALPDLRSPGLHLEALRGDRASPYSIRINDRYRICFQWRDGDAYGVEIVDYH